MINKPFRQLELLLRPVGILTFTSGSGEIAEFLQARYGTTDSEQLEQRFKAKLEGVRSAKVIILGVPNDNGAGFDRGSKKGPLGIRTRLLGREELYTRWEEAGVCDIGDVRDHPLLTDDRILNDWAIQEVRNARWGAEGAELDLPVSAHSILDRVLECIQALNPDSRVLMIGGDHSNSEVPVEVLCRGERNKNGKLGILQLDAHTDLLENRDGLPISYATWAWHANEALGRKGQFVQVGVRTSGTERSSWEESLNLQQIWAHEIAERSLEDAVNYALAPFEELGVERIYLSNDIDGISPEFAAATGTPEPNGLHPSFVFELIEQIGARFELIGSDLMEVAPTLSRNIPEEPDRTLSLAADLVEAQVAAMLRGC